MSKLKVTLLVCGLWQVLDGLVQRFLKKRALNYYLPIGATDSEHAFCWLLDQVRKKFRRRPVKEQQLWGFLHKLALELNGTGIFNFLLSDSYNLYAFCSNKMCWIIRQAPFGKARLIDTGKMVDFSKETTPDDRVAVVASRPLTGNEIWNKMDRAEFNVFQQGEVFTI